MPKRILVVNDTQEILELFREILTEEGYEFIGYSFAVQDMDDVEHVKPDLIILDCLFGEEKTGWQMLQKLKMRRSTAGIPVVICTAAVQAVREIEGYLASKGVGVVLKPFEINDLLWAVEQALASHDRMASIDETDARSTDKPSDSTKDHA